jgi:SAM-dependent methyltransferase
VKVFGKYAGYYDLLYSDKDYETETNYILGLVEKFGNSGKLILELGCGTGKHAICLAKRGFKVCGVDLSEQMVSEAKERSRELGGRIAENVNFMIGDIRRLELRRKFDAAIALFHVVSYQTTNEDLRAVFRVVREHLKPEAIFVFDFWYGPAVLTQRPQVREKTFADNMIKVTRVTTPREFPNDNYVEVNFNLEICDKTNGAVETFQECHRMRYLFLPEVREFLAGAGMEMAFSYGWMTDKEPGFDTWGVCCGAVVAE